MPAYFHSRIDTTVLDLDHWFNLVGLFGCGCWILAYGMIIRRCYREQTYGLPAVAICCNLAWESLDSWILPVSHVVWHTLYRLWFFVDLVITYQLLRHGPPAQVTAAARKYFYPLIFVGLVLALIGQYTFITDYQDSLGLVMAFMVNLLMSLLFIRMYILRPDRRGLSVSAAWLKMLGTLSTSVQCHYLVRVLDPGVKSLAFLTFLGVSIFLSDCLYIYLVMKRSRPPSPAEAGNPSPLLQPAH